MVFFLAKVSKYDPSSRYPISRDEFRTTATIFRLFEFQLQQILTHIGPIFGQKAVPTGAQMLHLRQFCPILRSNQSKTPIDRMKKKLFRAKINFLLL